MLGKAGNVPSPCPHPPTLASLACLAPLPVKSEAGWLNGSNDKDLVCGELCNHSGVRGAPAGDSDNPQRGPVPSLCPASCQTLALWQEIHGPHHQKMSGIKGGNGEAKLPLLCSPGLPVLEPCPPGRRRLLSPALPGDCPQLPSTVCFPLFSLLITRRRGQRGGQTLTRAHRG